MIQGLWKGQASGAKPAICNGMIWISFYLDYFSVLNMQEHTACNWVVSRRRPSTCPYFNNTFLFGNISLFHCYPLSLQSLALLFGLTYLIQHNCYGVSCGGIALGLGVRGGAGGGTDPIAGAPGKLGFGGGVTAGLASLKAFTASSRLVSHQGQFIGKVPPVAALIS